jgi:MFS family permease
MHDLRRNDAAAAVTADAPERGYGPGRRAAFTSSPAYRAAREEMAKLPVWQRPFASLRIRDYRLLWMGQLGTSMGQWMDQVSRGYLVYELTGSPFLLGAVTATRAIPLLLFGVLAGVVADRYGRKNQLIISQTGNALINLLIALLYTTGHLEVWHVFATGLLAGTLQAFQQPARQALISDIVGEGYIMNAVALNSTVLNVSRSIGPAVAGWLIALVGSGGGYYAQTVVYLFATIWTVQMRVPQHSPSSAGAREGSMMSGLLEGFTYIRRNETVLMLLLLALVPLLLGQPYSNLLPVIAKDVLEIGPQGLGYLFTAAGMGAMAGALYIAAAGDMPRKGMFMLGGATLFGAALMALSFSSWLPVSLGLLAVIGFANTSYNALANTILQTSTPPDLRGRVLSIYLLNRGLVPLGTLLAGSLATWFGAPWAVRIMGTGCAVLALWAAVKVPALRSIE